MKLKKMLSAAISCCLFLSAFTGISTFAAGSRVSVHDPSIIKANGTYYVFGSHIEAAKTNDLQNWKSFANGYARTNNVEFGNLSQNLQKAFAWAGEDLEDCEGGFAVWAPDVVWDAEYINADGSRGAYLMYFCTSSTYMRSVIAYAVSKNVEGPYTFADTLIYSGFTNNDAYVRSSTKNVNKKYTSTNIDELISAGQVTFNNSWFRNNDYNNQLFPNAIDPTIYFDTDGRMYMCYGSWSGGIFTLEIDPKTGQCIHPKSGTTADGRMIDSYFGTKISGGYGKSGEGPFIEYNADTGYYYLWVTYGGLTSTGGYNMRVFRSLSPLGPFTDAAGNQAVLSSNSNLDSIGLKVMGNYKFSSLSKAYMACGHNSVLRDDDGKWYIFYHTRFDDGAEFHEVRVHSMYFNDEGWPVVAPYEYAGDVISATGYDESDIIGDYEFIDHGSSTDGKIIGYSNIKLNADGSISGSVSGRWSQAKDSSSAEIIIGNQKYSGYFLAAKDENGKKVMSFTAVGSNNRTVWGAQTKQFTGKERQVGIIDYTDKDSQIVYSRDVLLSGGYSSYLSGTELLSDVSYYIVNRNSGMAVDIPNGKLEAGTNIQQWEQNGSWAQQWRITSLDNDYCYILSAGDENMCIGLAENSGGDGVNFELQQFTGAETQKFRIEKCGSYYGIVTAVSGNKSGFDVYEWSKENGGNINQWNYRQDDCQLWSIIPVHPYAADGAYSLRSIASSSFLDAEDGDLSLSTKYDIDTVKKGLMGKTDDHLWTFIRLADGSYTVKNKYGEALTANDSGNVTTEAYTGDSSQIFRIICNKDGSYSLIRNEKCVTIYSEADNVTLKLEEFKGTADQKLVLTPEVPRTGDVNYDGKISAADLVMLQKFLLNGEAVTSSPCADVNYDGIIDVFDSIRLRKILLMQ